MKNHCDIKGCKEPLSMVYLTICAQGHINEYYLCADHAIAIHLHDKSCDQLHIVVDHMASTVKGGEPEDYRFYLGEWVAVKDNKVIRHGANPEDLVDYAIRNNHAGMNVFEVKQQHLDAKDIAWT